MTTVEGVLDVCLHIKIAACVDLHRLQTVPARLKRTRQNVEPLLCRDWKIKADGDWKDSGPLNDQPMVFFPILLFYYFVPLGFGSLI